MHNSLWRATSQLSQDNQLILSLYCPFLGQEQPPSAFSYVEYDVDRAEALAIEISQIAHMLPECESAPVEIEVGDFCAMFRSNRHLFDWKIASYGQAVSLVFLLYRYIAEARIRIAKLPAIA